MTSSGSIPSGITSAGFSMTISFFVTSSDVSAPSPSETSMTMSIMTRLKKKPLQNPAKIHCNVPMNIDFCRFIL